MVVICCLCRIRLSDERDRFGGCFPRAKVREGAPSANGGGCYLAYNNALMIDEMGYASLDYIGSRCEGER